jgi:hypothetical protein
MLATQMRMNQEEAMRNSIHLRLTGQQIVYMRVPVYPARGVQQTVVSQYYAPTLRTPTLVRTESRPLATALEIMETDRQKSIEDMQTKQAETPEPEIPKAPVSTPDTEEEKDEEKAKDKKEEQDQASTPNQETQGRNNGSRSRRTCNTPRRVLNNQRRESH